MILVLSLLLSLPVLAEDGEEEAPPQATEPPADQDEGEGSQDEPAPAGPPPGPPPPGAGPPPGPPPAGAGGPPPGAGGPPPGAHPRPPQGPDHPAPIGPPPPREAHGGPPHPPPPIHPVAEVRLNWDFSRLDNVSGEKRGDDFSHRFSVPRAELGLVAQISDRIETRTVFHATEAHETVDVDATLTGEHLVERYPRGWAFQAQDVYATLQPMDTDAFWIQPGVQMTIFGSRNYFDEARDNYYLVGPRTEELAELAGVVHGRDLGLRVHGDVGKRLGVDAMIANGNGHTGIGEDNVAKDLSLRLDVAATDALHVIASGERAVDGEEGARAHMAWSVMTEWRAESARVMVEAIGGTNDRGSGDVRQFLGGQGGLALEGGCDCGPIDSRVVTARVGYFDPRIHTVDADAWLTADLSLQGWWSARGPMGMMTGLGYNLWMPMDITEPVGHSVSLQTLFQL